MRFGIIGCGVIAFTHATALKQIPGVSLYAVCDIIADKAAAFATEHGAERVYASADALLADPLVEVVCVCVPSGLHGEICIAAAKAGKAIVCEKPMEITPEKMRRIVSVVEETGVRMQCIFQRRTMPAAIAVRDLIRTGALGRICLAEAQLKYYRDQAYYDSAGWRGTWELDGGGALMNQGVHGVDLILWLLGEPIKTLYGRALTLARDIAVEDTAAAILEMRSGALCVIQSATTAFPGFTTAFTIHGEKGSVGFDDDGITTWSFIDPDQEPPRPDSGEAVGGAQSAASIGSSGHVLLLQDIAQAVRDNRPPSIPPRDAMRAVETICAIYRSTREGRALAVNPQGDFV